MAYPSPHPMSQPAPVPPYPRGAGSEELLSDIARTRGEIDRILQALARRLRPRNLLREATVGFRRGERSMARHAPSRETVNRWGRDAADQARVHPLPLALAGVALVGAGGAWLMRDHLPFNRRRPPTISVPPHGGSYVDARTGQPYDARYGSEFHQGQPAVPIGASPGPVGPFGPAAGPPHPQGE